MEEKPTTLLDDFKTFIWELTHPLSVIIVIQV